MKYLHANQLSPKQYFWRTHDKQEIDYLEEADGKLHAFEFKWSIKKRKVPPAFAKAYPGAKMEWIDKDNVEGFLE